MPVVQNTLQNRQGFYPYLSGMLGENSVKLDTIKMPKRSSYV